MMARPSKTEVLSSCPEELELRETTLSPHVTTPGIEITDAGSAADSSDSGYSNLPSPASLVPPRSAHSPSSSRTSLSSVDQADLNDGSNSHVQQAYDIAESGIPRLSSVSQHVSDLPTPSESQEGPHHHSPTALPEWRHILSSDTGKKVMSLSVVILTIVTVVYSHRSFVTEKWNNLEAWWEYCQNNDYGPESCFYAKHHDLPSPPYPQSNQFFATSGKQQSDDSSDDTLINFKRYFPPIMAFALGALCTALAAWFIVRKRYDVRKKAPNQSMARRPLLVSSPAQEDDSVCISGEQSKRRFRAFVTMEQALGDMKLRRASEATSTSSNRRASSNPYSRRNSWLKSSIFENPEYYEYDPGSESKDRWRQVKIAAETVSTLTASTRHSSTSSSVKASSKPLDSVPGDRDETMGNGGPGIESKPAGRKAVMPLTIFNRGDPELEEGDFDAGAAFVGAIVAATVGGGAMKRCPVEVPIPAARLAKLEKVWIVKTK